MTESSSRSLNSLGIDPDSTLARAVERVRLHRKFFAVMIGAGIVAGFAYHRLAPKRFSSAAAIVPQAFSQSGLRGIASQLGLEVGSDAGQSPDFYQELLKTDGVLVAVAESLYAVPGQDSGQRASLMDIWEISGATPEARMQKTARQLRKQITSASSRRTGMLTFSVEASDATLARDIARRCIEELGRFNVRTRRTRASLERQFVEGRISEAQGQLRSAEDALATFVVRNRGYGSDPELRLEYDRLNRLVAIRQLVFQSLSQNFEQARIDEVRDTPVFTIVEAPRVPSEQRRRLRTTLLGWMFAFGFLAGTLVVLAPPRWLPKW